MTPVPSRSLLQRAFVLISTASLCAALAGCTMGKIQLSGPAQTTEQGKFVLTGKVHGGYGPISGSTIQLWAVGTSGYGSAATELLPTLTPITTGTSGDFNITGDYTCPSASTPVYITATGGDAGAGSNSAIVLAAALGQCGDLSSSSYIWINEVTTAATAYALGQYFNYPSESFSYFPMIGYPGSSDTQALTGITNAFATYNNLVNNTTGAALTTGTMTANVGSPAVSMTITMTPESQKLNTIADILASCVDTDGTVTYSTANPSSDTACGTLFGTISTYDGGSQPNDTLQAAVMLSLYPTMSSSDMANLYALQTGTGAPFAGQGTQPNDWTLGIEYQDTTPTVQMVKPQNLAIDGSGNVWVLSNNGGAGSLVELSPTGTPLDDAQNVEEGTTSTNFGPSTAAPVSINPRNIAIDTNNNVWFTTSSSSGYVFEYANSGATNAGYATGKAAYGISINGVNDVFVSQQSGSAVYQLYEFPGGNLNEPVGYPLDSSFKEPEYIGFDTSGDLWMDAATAESAQEDQVLELSGIPTDATLVTDCAGTYPCVLTSGQAGTYTVDTFNGSNKLEPWGMSAGVGSMFFAGISTTYDAVEELPVPYTGTATQIGGTAGSEFDAPYFAATDGAGNVWVSNRSAAGTTGGSVSEISSAGSILSPVSSSPSTITPGFVHQGLSSGEGIGVDPSGNVWVANNTGGGGGQYAVFEIVGAAAPTVTPIATALANSKVGARP